MRIGTWRDAAALLIGLAVLMVVGFAFALLGGFIADRLGGAVFPADQVNRGWMNAAGVVGLVLGSFAGANVAEQAATWAAARVGCRGAGRDGALTRASRRSSMR